MINKIIIALACTALVFIIGTNIFAQGTSKNPKQRAQKVQNVHIEIAEMGYQPASFKLKKGVPARLEFIRKTEDECGREVVIPAYHIRRELPLNKAVIINLTPAKTGSFSFACGMNMMRGKVIVQWPQIYSSKESGIE